MYSVAKRRRPKEVIRPKASTYQCPNCNGVLHFDPASGHLVCDFCGGSFEQDLRADAVAEKRVDGIEEVVLQETSSEVKGISTCVLPVWLMHCAWDEHQMLFAVNGETGKCVGDLPIDRKRRALTIVALAVIAFIVMFLISAVMQSVDAEKGRGIFIGGIILAVIVPLIADGIFRGQMKTAVEATTAGMSYTGEGLVVTERWSTGKFYIRKSKARSKLEEAGV